MTMKKENYMMEKELENMPKAIPYEVLKILGTMLETHICKIIAKDGSRGTGFFCNIPCGWNTLKVLMTNNHVLNADDILPNQIIKFSLNNEAKKYDIKIDGSRKTYTSKEYDVTIIEIKQSDKLDKNSFFDIDLIFGENVIEEFRNKQIYLLHYPKGVKMEYSVGLIGCICEDNYNIHHLCDSWALSGFNLPDEVLKKLYHDNAERILTQYK